MERSQNNIFETLKGMFPEAKCELDYTNAFELLVSVVLSAQTTDKRVNIVTKDLFKKYPNPNALASADYDDVKEIIKSIGLASTKAKNIINLSHELDIKFNGIVPNTREELMMLPGVGRKTANVMLGVYYHIPAIAVDTHVSRVANRLGLSENDDVLKIEEDLMKFFDKDKWSDAHHYLLFFGRYFCLSQKPNCEKGIDCPFKDICKRTIK